MICRLTNVCDVALFIGFDSGREEMLQPTESCLYNDQYEILLDTCWNFVEMGWIKDEDYEEATIEKHAWAIKGF